MFHVLVALSLAVPPAAIRPRTISGKGVYRVNLRADQQDYLGTSITVEVARKLEVPRITLVVNNVPPVFDTAEVRKHVEEAYGCEVAAVFPHFPETHRRLFTRSSRESTGSTVRSMKPQRG